ncbi:Uncharacterised protein [Streptococcus gallolyticus]|uniref:SCP2 domain-containing protein n=1 Tax=Streptococcus gallolyticus TaxID=315405 RepID=A0AA94M1K2_9STRE|nr:SCP2 sterol-binding domain-containing protein [Streptococcus gallolyticus]AQP41312.1 hypothetical protein BTR42_01565 [Streptococcus gallolyticus subsp. gallolyticus DSM 16831]SQG78594.1 Uncharacterised protein [Streptococcus gallolyticus]
MTKESIPSAENFFQEYWKDAKTKEDGLAEELCGTLQFDFRPSEDGVFVIRVENGKLLPLERTAVPNPTMSIRVGFPDFYKVKIGEEKFWKLLLFRKVKISGDKSFTKNFAAAGIN